MKVFLKLTRIFKFEASHQLKEAYSKKCKNLHGHSWKLFVTVEGRISENNMVIDLGEVEDIVNERVISKLDHTHLNKVFNEPNPTMEYLVYKIWDWLKDCLPLSELVLWETSTSYISYNGKC